jgi:hypothetical protein
VYSYLKLGANLIGIINFSQWQKQRKANRKNSVPKNYDIKLKINGTFMDVMKVVATPVPAKKDAKKK